MPFSNHEKSADFRNITNRVLLLGECMRFNVATLPLARQKEVGPNEIRITLARIHYWCRCWIGYQPSQAAEVFNMYQASLGLLRWRPRFSFPHLSPLKTDGLSTAGHVAPRTRADGQKDHLHWIYTSQAPERGRVFNRQRSSKGLGAGAYTSACKLHSFATIPPHIERTAVGNNFHDHATGMAVLMK